MPSVTLTGDNATAARVLTNLGKTLNLGRDATLQEYHDWLADITRRMIQGQELADAHTALNAQPPTPVVLT